MLVGVAVLREGLLGSQGSSPDCASTPSPRCSTWPTGTSSWGVATTSTSPPSPRCSSTCGPSPSRSSSTSCGHRWSCCSCTWAGNCAVRRLSPVLAVAVCGAIASAVDMRLSYQGGASVMRLYEGTDTRSQDILVGAALAIAMAMWAQHRTSLPSAPVDAPDRSRVGEGHPRRPGPPACSRPGRTEGTCTAGGASASGPSPPGRSGPARCGPSSRWRGGRPPWPGCCSAGG